MNEIKQLRTVSGVAYMERNWTVVQARSTAAAEMAELDRAWQALAEAPPGEASEAEARRLLVDTLTAYRSVALWAAKTVLPPWQVDDGHLVIGAVRVPLTAGMLADWIQGEGDADV